MLLAGMDGRNTPVLQKYLRSSLAATFESSCGFHGSSKLLPVGHHGRKLRERFANQVMKHIADSMDKPG